MTTAISSTTKNPRIEQNNEAKKPQCLCGKEHFITEVFQWKTAEAYKQLYNTLNCSKARINCLGIIKLECDYFKGSISLDKVEKKFIGLIRDSERSGEDYTEEERDYGNAILDKIEEWRSERVRVYNCKPCLVRLIWKIVDAIAAIFRKKYPNRYHPEMTFHEHKMSRWVKGEFPWLRLKQAEVLYDRVIEGLIHKLSDKGLGLESNEAAKEKAISMVKEKYLEVCKENEKLNFANIFREVKAWAEGLHKEVENVNM